MFSTAFFSVAFAFLVLAAIFTFGMYASYKLFEGHSVTRFLFWSLVVMIFGGIVLPCVLTGQAVGLGLCIGTSTILGTVLARRR